MFLGVHAHGHCPQLAGVGSCAITIVFWLTVWGFSRIHEEEDIYVAVDARTESLQTLRELGPPDLVYLVKQPKANSTRQVYSQFSMLSVYTLLTMDGYFVLADRRVPPCHRNRCLFVRQSRRLR